MNPVLLDLDNCKACFHFDYDILTLNVLHDSAKSAGEINIAHVNSRTKDKSATGVIDHAASDFMQPSFDSVNGSDTASSNIVIVFGVEKDPADIGNINENIDANVNENNDSNINSRGKDKRAIGVIDHATSDVMPPSFDSVNSDAVIVFGVEMDPAHIGNITKNIDDSVNDSNDNNINSRKDKSAVGVLGHAVSDVMRPISDGINGNDTTSSDTISVTRVEKDPVNISSVNMNVDNSIIDNSDNKVIVIIMDFCLVPRSNVSHVTYSTKGIVGCGVGGEVVVAGVSQSVSPLPANSEAKIVYCLAIRKQSPSFRFL